jgi:ABC-type microcin C transport system permease subunit YejE
VVLDSDNNGWQKVWFRHSYFFSLPLNVSSRSLLPRMYEINRIGSIVLKACFMCDLAQFLFTSWTNLSYVVSTRFYKYCNPHKFRLTHKTSDCTTLATQRCHRYHYHNQFLSFTLIFVPFFPTGTYSLLENFSFHTQTVSQRHVTLLFSLPASILYPEFIWFPSNSRG